MAERSPDALAGTIQDIDVDGTVPIEHANKVPALPTRRVRPRRGLPGVLRHRCSSDLVSGDAPHDLHHVAIIDSRFRPRQVARLDGQIRTPDLRRSPTGMRLVTDEGDVIPFGRVADISLTLPQLREFEGRFTDEGWLVASSAERQAASTR
jgi:hypothetical protein